jgi:hypothetical protein
MSSARSIDDANSKPFNDMQEKSKDVDEKTFNPWSPKFLTVMIGMYMSVFLVALVRLLPIRILHEIVLNLTRTAPSSL